MSDNSPVKRDDFDPDRSAKTQKMAELRQQAMARVRTPPSPEAMARRRLFMSRAKWGLPSFAAFLLLSIAIWPELNHLIHQNNSVLEAMLGGHSGTGNIQRAIYRDVDSKNRPYTITSRNAHQIDDNRINLIKPVADIMLNNQQWVHVRADTGVYLQHEQTLTLNGHVTLYRSDGLLLNSPTADIDISQEVIATHNWVHAEGPFGTEDAEGAFLDQQTGTAQFLGAGKSDHFDDLSPPPPSPNNTKSP